MIVFFNPVMQFDRVKRMSLVLLSTLILPNPQDERFAAELLWNVLELHQSFILHDRYFVGTILQFQIYRAMCRASRQYDPNDPQRSLHKCDVYRQPEAGNILKKLMEKGSSQPWQQVLEEVIGEGRLDGSALRDYFRPLEEWLRYENLRNQEPVGWSYDGDYCKRSIETANLQVYGGFYNFGQVLRGSSVIVLVLVFLGQFVTILI